jgi:hypothetical protein
MKKYILIKEADYNAFVDSVNEKLEYGYKLVGGISMVQSAYIHNSFHYAQAMVKDIKENELSRNDE